MASIRKKGYLAVVFGMALALPVLGAQTPDVFVSDTQLQQAGTLMVQVKNEIAEPVGRLGNVKLRFSLAQNNRDWVALVGMPVNKITGKYVLSVSIPGKAAFRETIAVSRRNFPIRPLVVTKELAAEGYSAKKIASTR